MLIALNWISSKRRL